MLRLVPGDRPNIENILLSPFSLNFIKPFSPVEMTNKYSGIHLIILLKLSEKFGLANTI